LFLYRLLLRCRKSGNELQSVRAGKDRITKLYQSSQARVKDYQGTIRNLTDQFKASQATIRRIESETSALDSAIGNATDSVGRVEAILGRMETAIGGLKKTDQ
jgi:hypothetical protein